MLYFSNCGAHHDYYVGFILPIIYPLELLIMISMIL